MQYLLLKRRELGVDGRSTGLMPCPRIPEGFLSRSLAQQLIDEAHCMLLRQCKGQQTFQALILVSIVGFETSVHAQRIWLLQNLRETSFVAGWRR